MKRPSWLPPWPVHPVLCTSLFVLLWFRDGRAHIEPAQALGYLAICAAATALLQVALHLTTRRAAAAAVSLTLVLCVFWTFTPLATLLYRALDATGLNALLRVRHVLAALVLALLALIWWRRDRLDRLSRHADCTFALLAVITLGQALLAKAPRQPIVVAPPKTLQLPPRPDVHKPDIYWIILDAYTSIDRLREHWDHHPEAWLHELRSHALTVREDARSNYSHTLLTMASVLGLDYVDLPEGLTYPQQLVFLRRAVAQATLLNTLREQGYQIVNLSFTDFAAARRRYDLPYFTTVPDWEDLLLKTPLQHRLPPPADLELRLVEELKQQVRAHRPDVPRLVYVHLLLPHSPYRYDEEGHLAAQPVMDRRDMAGYLRQVKFSEKIILSILTEVNRTYAADHKPVLIIHGDHGFRLLEGPAREDVAFSCFLGLSLPGVDAGAVQAVRSPVNVFRLVLNEYFGAGLPLLPDEQYRHTDHGLERRTVASP